VSAETPEVRHYIALIGTLHGYMMLTPREVLDAFAEIGPNDPIVVPGSGNTWYPVSQAIADEWTAEDES
jgi:hypothetical protein